jgi:UPF0271 protein
MAITINCDMGEGFGLFRCGDDEGLMPYIHIANVACGFHAGDPAVMRRTVRSAKAHGVAVGAHPSFPDLQGFGRREMKMQPDELVAALIYQIGALKGFLDAEGLKLNHIKPHGALYGVAMRDRAVTEAIAEAVAVFGVPVLGMAGTLHETVYRARGLAFIAEYYIDLDYTDDGALIITREHAAKDPEEAALRAVRVARERIATTIGSQDLAMPAECFCLHSDTPNAAALARTVHGALRPWFAG